MNRKIVFWPLIVILFSCNPKIEKKLNSDFKYIGEKDYSPDKEYDLRSDTLVIAFSSYFDDDTVNVKYNNIDSTIVISTDEVTGLAFSLMLGQIVDTKMILRINDFEPVEILVNKENQLFLIEKHVSTLKVRSRYYLPGFY